MFLNKIANIICEKGTSSENTLITVKTYTDKRTLWNGKAKDLKNWAKDNGGWIVVEVLIDTANKSDSMIPDYNRGKIITVI